MFEILFFSCASRLMPAQISHSRQEVVLQGYCITFSMGMSPSKPRPACARLEASHREFALNPREATDSELISMDLRPHCNAV
jgi:hypothetical protein